MALTEYESLKGLEIITQDACILGRIMDVRFEDLTWNIQGFKVKSENKISKTINVSGKSMILLQPGKYIFGDVVLMSDTIESAKTKVTADNGDFKSVSTLIGKRVLSQENVAIGTVESIQLDLESWTVVSMKIKLEKTGYEPLEIKKGLFAKRVSGILMTHIAEIGEDIKLNLNIFGIKSQIVIE